MGDRIKKETARRILRRYLSASMTEQALDQLYPKRKQLPMAERARRAAEREAERKAG